ncbi:uncharacterized protein BXZ73DRAFT_104621 [Epithele typhae]|uniref:uncharacterized protein n=1 Tax=Epithele typhae TaxID=378194 RepID=UPI002007BE28|nr:uncharacterized protein BXZ73DRAFT_104621 [Epithele typhae]KAH9920891.1 hypothetical protein BXZ73DRAFT_104621 [Epithele typhae]
MHPAPPSAVHDAEHAQWAPVVDAPSLTAALSAIPSALADSTPLVTDPSYIPPWVLLALFRKQPANADEASTTHALLAASSTPGLTPLFAILDAHWVVKFSLFRSLAQAVKVLHGASDDPRHRDLFLRVVASSPVRDKDQVYEFLAQWLRSAIRERTPLHSRTYKAILENRVANVRIAHLVQTHMRLTKLKPNLGVAVAFIKLFAAAQDTRAMRLWWRIRRGQYYGDDLRHSRKPKFLLSVLRQALRSLKSPLSLHNYSGPLLRKTGPDDAPKLPAEAVSVEIWLKAVQTAAVDLDTRAERLLTLYHEGRSHLPTAYNRLFVDFVVIKGLLRRQDRGGAIGVLRNAMKMKRFFTGHQLCIAVEALTKVGRPDLALRLLLEFVDGPLSERASSVMYTITINSFMHSLLSIGRLDVVFFLWDTMERVFLVDQDDVTFGILLKAARLGKKREGLRQVALADLGLGRLLPRTLATSELERAPYRLSREDAIAGLRSLLSPGSRRSVTGFWRGERAGRVALRVAWQVLIGNYPQLTRIRAPFRAVRKSAEAQAVSPLTDLYHSFVGMRADPSPGVFRALIDLLAAEDQAGHIPLVLAWMRELRVQPANVTLASAMVYWGEVAIEGPWIESLKGAESEYMQFVQWVQRWVGKRGTKDGVLSGQEVGEALKRVKVLREMQVMRPPEAEALDDAWFDGL